MGFTVNLPITVPANMPNLSTAKFWLHVSQFALTLLTIIIVAPVISIEVKYWGGSKAAPNWTLVVGILTLLLPVAMLYFPWAYDRQDKFKALGKFFIKSRSAIVLTSFSSFLWLTAALAMTVHSTDAVNCALDDSLVKSDSGYASSWANQCNCGKATAALAWFSSFAWIGTVAISAIVMYTEKQQIQQNLKNHEMNAAADRTHDNPVDPTYRPYDEEEYGVAGGAGSHEQMPLNSPEVQDMHQQTPYYDHSPPPPPHTQSPEYQGYDSPMPMPMPSPSPAFGHSTEYHAPQVYDPAPGTDGYYRQPLLILNEDSRGIIPIASFGFLAGGQLKLEWSDFKLSNPSAPGNLAFYVRKSMSEDATYMLDEELPETSDSDAEIKCFLDASFIKDEVADGLTYIVNLDSTKSEGEYQHIIQPDEEDLWTVHLVNCKESDISMTLNTTEVNPGPNFLSAGDSPLPLVYGVSSIASFIAAVLWGSLLVSNRSYKVFKSHYLMLALMTFVGIDKAFESAKYHYMKIGVVAEGWTIGFYIFAFIKGSLSILIIVLVASGWMFIKPFLSAKDKRIISIIVPIQVLANIASVFVSEAAIGSIDWAFWNNLLPLADLAGCGVVLWTILQTRKHLNRGSEADGKELDVLRKYKLWSTFYIVTLAYLYVTRIIVGFLQIALPFRYVNWLGESVSEVATLLFYIFIGYKFRPYSDNPYTQVPTDDEEDECDQDLSTSRETHGLQQISRRDNSGQEEYV